MKLISSSEQKATIIDYLKMIIRDIEECDYVETAKVNVDLNHDILYGSLNFKEYSISIIIKE